MRSKGSVSAVAVILSVLFLEARAGAGEMPAVMPAEVYVRVAELRDEIEGIRYEMGRPKALQPEIGIRNVTPGQVYFQARTLFLKSDRLAFEQTRTTVDPPLVPTSEPRPSDVLILVDAARERVRAVEADLGLESAGEPPSLDHSKQPSDVFRSIVQANRQLNLLLERRFSPADVYQEVTLAVGYAARLRSRFPGDRIPDEPPRQPGKQPSDVYRVLLECLQRLGSIAEVSALQVAQLDVTPEEIEAVTPSDVYDIASLVVSELAHLHRRARNLENPRATYYPGRVFPSDVHRRALLLGAQLTELEALVQENPAWLAAGSERN
jgi:hypothetical protein